MIDPDTLLKQLKGIGKEELIERLHKIYPTVDKKTRIKFLTLLNTMHDNTHFDVIENYFISDEDPEVRIEAAKCLAFNHTGKRAIEPLIWVINNEKNKIVRISALRLLVALYHRKEFKEIIRNTLNNLLESRDPKIKMEAIESIGILKITTAANELLRLMNSDKKLIKVKVIQTIDNLELIKAVPFLIDSLATESYDIWYFSFHTLKNLLGKKLESILVQKLKEINKKTIGGIEVALLKKGILKALGEIGSRDIVDVVLLSLKDDYYWVREEARQTLDKIEPNWEEKYKNISNSSIS